MSISMCVDTYCENFDTCQVNGVTSFEIQLCKYSKQYSTKSLWVSPGSCNLLQRNPLEVKAIISSRPIVTLNLLVVNSR